MIGTSVSFNDRFILPSLVPFLVIYDVDANRQNFPESFSLSIENGTKAQHNLPFIGHYTNRNKSTKYHSYIKSNNHYWLKVNVTKNTPFKLLREIPWEVSFPSLLIYFCLSITTVRNITKERKEKLKAKKLKKTKMLIDVLKNLQIKGNIQLVRTRALARYLEHDRRKKRLPDRPAKYLTDLRKRIEKVTVSKITERAYVYEGNHRMAVSLIKDAPWVPLKINYFFLNGDQDKKFRFMPRLVNRNWPANPKPSDLGFETRPV